MKNLLIEKQTTNPLRIIYKAHFPNIGIQTFLTVYGVPNDEGKINEYVINVNTNPTIGGYQSTMLFSGESLQKLEIVPGEIYLSHNEELLRSLLWEHYSFMFFYDEFIEDILEFFIKEFGCRIIEPEIYNTPLSTAEFRAEFKKRL